jgi:transcription elongation factor Elf1
MSLVVQEGTVRFKDGWLDLAWDCPFCGDHNEWGCNGLPPVVAFPSAIPCYCHDCQKSYAIEVRQKLTGVITREMNQ